MAVDSRAKYITINFTYAGKTHGLRMTYGTAKALSISEAVIGIGFGDTSVAAHTVKRRLYPGGPTLATYNVAEKVRPVAVGPSSGGSRTNKKMVVKGDNANETATIYYSGPLHSAVAWLTANARIANGTLGQGYSLYSSTGRPLARKQNNLLNPG